MGERTPSRQRGWRLRLASQVLGLVVMAAASAAVYGEMQTSWLQAELFSSYARKLEYAVGDGASSQVAYPKDGPYDRRLGYVGLPRFVERLRERGFAVARQARLSDAHLDFVGRGGFPIYPEKAQAGLVLLDQRGEPLLERRVPGRIYGDFEAIPELVLATLLFIENRELLDLAYPARNPAVEWDRLLLVLPQVAVQQLDPSRKVAGGSTLATQIEKFRHASDGRTTGARDKLRQIVSASVRAYRDGRDTRDVRRQLAVDYLNATPLSAQAGFGEVLGLGDGLFAWFGADFEQANAVLRARPADDAAALVQAQLYKQALSLLIAQRRPSFYLHLQGRAALARLTDSHLRLLAARGVIPAELARRALPLPLEIHDRAPPASPRSFVEEKAANAVRVELLNTLGIPGTYQLDRLDLMAHTTLDRAAQQRVSELLQSLADPEVARSLGLVGHRLLGAKAAADAPVYSLTVYERAPGANLVRVQADNLDRPFDVNQGAKLDLGSTAKLRTLITYLEIMADLHDRLAGAPMAQLREFERSGPDPLTRFVAGQLVAAPGTSLAQMLDAALARRYSASPWESFFTGGGLHRFDNFDADDNGRVMSVAQAFRNSVNLVFIRMMRDIVRHYGALAGADTETIIEDPRHPLRQGYLERFADREAREFLTSYYWQFAELDADQALTRLADAIGRREKRLAAAFRSVRPDASPEELMAFLGARLGGAPEARAVQKLYDMYAPERFTLSDQAYLAHVHPLKLWLVGYLQQHATPSRAEVMEASAQARRESYQWLFKTRNKRAQDRRIRILLEEEAFRHLHAAWARLGYPFEDVVPSLATSIGSSADRPDALAELMGIILNDGIRQPAVRIGRLHFAAGTPFEVDLVQAKRAPERVLAPEIAAAVRQGLRDVVENGTARRMHKAFVQDDGTALVIGAKTGTGDHRRKQFGAGGRLLGSTVVSRSATVVFYVGDAFFGTLTVFVPGPAAADFSFTSSLPAQLLKGLAPALQPLFNGHSAPRTAEAGAAAEG